MALERNGANRGGNAPESGMTPGESPEDVARRLDRLVRSSRAALFIERVWRASLPPLIVAGIFIGLSLLGVWFYPPVWLRFLAVAIFAFVFVWSCRDLLGVRWPHREEALARIEASGRFAHRPLTAVSDTLSSGSDDPATAALWRLHQKRMAEALKGMRAGAPDPRAYRRDLYALRVLALMLMITGLVASSGDRWSRIASAVRPPVDLKEIASRLDAWVTPPLYTARPPVYLTGQSAALRDAEAPVSVPQGSKFVVRSHGTDGFDVRTSGGIELTPVEAAGEGSADAQQGMPVERTASLSASGQIDLYAGDERITGWRFDVIPDELPEIHLTTDPEEQLSGSVKFSYLVQDDYGVVAAEADIQPVPQESASSEPPRPLVEAPHFPLSLPARSRTAKTGETIRDLTSHPWSGSEVEIVLTARDEAGQVAHSEPVRFTLPQRSFRNPLARAVVEQRRDLALDANNQARVITSFDALLLAPDAFDMRTQDYLGMRFAYRSLANAHGDEELTALLPLLWDLALTIEDGDLSLAERELRDAQEALRKALENGASDEEIAELMQNLRQAMNEYMEALAEQMRRNPQAMQPFNSQQQQRTLSQQDLDQMMDRIEELAKTGSRDAARELLAQMQQMLENLQTGRPQMAPDGMSSEMMEMLNQLGEMIQKQQQLMDQTHRFNQDQRRREQREDQGQSGQQGGQEPMTREQLEQALKQLQQGQGDLAQQLQDLMDQLAQNGQGREGNKGELGEAGDAMGRAGKSLGQGEGEEAVGQQGNALDALRRGAQSMVEQMMNQGDGPGMAQGRSQMDEDPLGRPRRTEGPDFGNQVKIPDEIDVQRARRVLEELRRRFSDPSRPQLELDYLERLLKRY
ncbi:TIGR02302 family protein [Roseibium suaedae]|uniref:TIGR02302 family protein n=1 Tax=Roseibium suaedae TaxID=735517 RepID=UPI001AD8FAD4|nr:TIGR02302 family protein [Roseibium suaedae]